MGSKKPVWSNPIKEQKFFLAIKKKALELTVNRCLLWMGLRSHRRCVPHLPGQWMTPGCTMRRRHVTDPHHSYRLFTVATDKYLITMAPRSGWHLLGSKWTFCPLCLAKWAYLSEVKKNPQEKLMARRKPLLCKKHCCPLEVCQRAPWQSAKLFTGKMLLGKCSVKWWNKRWIVRGEYSPLCMVQKECFPTSKHHSICKVLYGGESLMI